MFSHAHVRVELSRDLSFVIRINEGTFRGNLKSYFGFPAKDLDQLADKKVMPQDFLDQFREFANENTWRWWIFSQGLRFHILIDHVATEDTLRYVADLFMFTGGYQIFIIDTKAENSNMTTPWNDSGRLLLWRKGMNTKYYD